MIKEVVSEAPCNTSGSQKWAGASPNFIPSAVVISVFDVWLSRSRMFHCPVVWALSELENKIMADAAACVRKYLVEASVARGWWIFEMTGRMARVLSSSPIHASSQWWLDMVMIVPMARLIIRMVRMVGLIGKGRVLTDIFGVWA